MSGPTLRSKWRPNARQDRGRPKCGKCRTTSNSSETSSSARRGTSLSRPVSGQAFETTFTLSEAGYLYQRCRSLFASTRILLGAGYPEDAAILGRSLLVKSQLVV